MISTRNFALIATCAALALPSAALAQSAGDDQYVDPLAGLTGSDGSNSKPKPSDSAKSNGGSSSGSSSSGDSASSTGSKTVTSPTKNKPGAKAAAPINRPAIDVNGLSGIGSLVAVPVKHVTLVLGDIAHGRR